MSGIGTGGTITGVSRYIKKDKGKKIISIGIEPAGSAVISQHLAGSSGSLALPRTISDSGLMGALLRSHVQHQAVIFDHITVLRGDLVLPGFPLLRACGRVLFGF